jgi:hypothetical protein
VKRFEVTEVGQPALPAVDIDDDADILIGSAASARIRIPGPHAEHVRIAGDRWHALAPLAIDGKLHKRGASGLIPADGLTLELGAYRVRVSPAPAGIAPSGPQRTESLARELVRSLLGADAAPSLTVTRGPSTGARRELAPPESRLVIGRGDAAHWIILDEDLSREHAEIRRGWDGVFVRDLDSKNGTFIDNAPTDADGSLLYDGATITLGNLAMLFRDPAERHLKGEPISPAVAAAPPPPPADDTPGPSPWPFVIAAAIAGLALVGIAWVMMT